MRACFHEEGKQQEERKVDNVRDQGKCESRQGLDGGVKDPI